MGVERQPQVFCVYGTTLWLILSMLCYHKTIKTLYWVLEGARLKGCSVLDDGIVAVKGEDLAKKGEHTGMG